MFVTSDNVKSCWSNLHITPEPAPPVAAPPAPSILTVTVPDGVTAGQQIQIRAPSGQLVNVKVPEGCGPGSQFKIQV